MGQKQNKPIQWAAVLQVVVREVRGEWLEWFELTGKHNRHFTVTHIATIYNCGRKAFQDTQHVEPWGWWTTTSGSTNVCQEKKQFSSKPSYFSHLFVYLFIWRISSYTICLILQQEPSKEPYNNNNNSHVWTYKQGQSNQLSKDKC